MINLPGVVDVRSISKFGLSILTVIFEENVPDLNARQLVAEQLAIASADIPENLGIPQMMPITTGLGEIYQYILTVDPASGKSYSITELRTLQDWLIKRQLGGIEGVIEISSFGGFTKQ
jgi:cobalt-zinc-cadmium resistance protein CzcA